MDDYNFVIDNDRYEDGPEEVDQEHIANSFVGREHTAKARKFYRQLDAIDRQAAREARTDREQLTRLKMLGHGQCAEATRLRSGR